MENSDELKKIMEEYKVLKDKKEKLTKYKRDYQNIYYQKNTDKVKENQKKYHDKVKDERNVKQKIYYQLNKEKIQERTRERRKIKKEKKESEKNNNQLNTIKKED